MLSPVGQEIRKLPVGEISCIAAFRITVIFSADGFREQPRTTGIGPGRVKTLSDRLTIAKSPAEIISAA